ncbi:MAG: hypothetical protein WCO44_01440 [Bacteroidota bacterium]
MNSQQFSDLLHQPQLTDARSLPLLEDLVRRYPYCQSGQVLYACNLYREDDPQYPVQLKRAAAYAGDRRILRSLILLGKTETAPAVPAGDLHEASVPGIPPEAIPALPVEAPVFPAEAESTHEVTWELARKPSEEEAAGRFPAGETQERMTQEELLAIVKKRLAEINAEKNHDVNMEEYSPEGSRIPEPMPSADKKKLIDKFILDEPRISKPKATFFNPTDSAVRSNLDEEEIVSETLAQLYAKQGNIQKAVHIYEKLSLLNQEKSRYFAAQIENLKS